MIRDLRLYRYEHGRLIKEGRFKTKGLWQHYKYKYSYDLKNYKNIDPNVVSAILRNEGINQYVVPKVNNDWDGIIEAKSEKIDFKKLSKKYTIL